MALPCRAPFAGLMALMLGALALVGVPGLAQAERIALVVGNARYAHVQALDGPDADASAVGSALRSVGFSVTHLPNASSGTLDAALDALARDAQGAEGVLFWFAGHVVQDGGVNRLVPVDARLDGVEGMTDETLALDDIAARIGGSGTTLIFLDACRSTLVPGGLRGLGAATQGLAGFDAPAGTFVAFSIRPGSLSHDRCEGGPSPFARAFAANVGRQGQSVSDLMIRLRNEVELATGGRQVPWDQSSLRAQFHFVLQAEGQFVTADGGDSRAPDDGLQALMDDVVTGDTVLQGPVPGAGYTPAAEAAADEPALPVPPIAAPLRLAAAQDGRPVIRGAAGARAGQSDGPVPAPRAPPLPRLAPVAAGAAVLPTPGMAIVGTSPEASLPDALPPPAPADLPRLVQAELKRVGCYRLAVDGEWGQGSRRAVRRYLEAEKAAPTEADLEPTEALWRALSAETGQVCAPPPPEPAVARKAAPKPKATATAPAPKPKATATAPAPKPATAAPTTAKRKPKCTFVVVAIVCK